jgi:hypothetical protein
MQSTAPNGSAVIKVYRDVSALEELREFAHSRNPGPTGDLDFYRSIVCSFPEFVRPHVIVIFRDNKPQSLLLGRLERRKIDVRFGYLRVPTPNLNILTFDTEGWLSGLSADDSDLFVQEILSALRNGEADAASLHHIETAHPLYNLARSRPGRVFSDHLPLLQIHWVRRLGRSGSFLESLSKNRRKAHRRRTRLLFEAFSGEVRIDCFHDCSRIDELMQDAEAVARTSYQRGLNAGFVHDERTHRRLSLAARRGALRSYVLYLGNRPSAFFITSLWADVLCGDFMAFDPVHAKYQPGTYLLMKVIEEVEKEDGEPPLTTIDFGFGDAQYKTMLGSDHRQVASLYIFAPTVKGAALNLARTFASLADRAAKAVLERTGTLSRIKLSWRLRMAHGQGDA